MSLRRILTVDTDLATLKRKSDPVKVVDDDLRALMDDMLETMYDAPGIGLAAIQVGVPKRVIVMDISRGDEERAPRFFINPRSSGPPTRSRSTKKAASRCRRSTTRSSARRRSGFATSATTANRSRKTPRACSAVCIQHEMDHLEGVLFLDHLSRLKRERAVAKVRKAARTTRAAA